MRTAGTAIGLGDMGIGDMGIIDRLWLERIISRYGPTVAKPLTILDRVERSQRRLRTSRALPWRSPPHPKDEQSDENKEYHTSSDRENFVNCGRRLCPCFP